MRGTGMGRLSLLVVAAGLGLGGCATTGSGPPGHDRVISRTELTGNAEASLYETIDRLRPGWLGPTAKRDPNGQPVIYMNRLYLGDATSLSSVRSRDVVEVRLISPAVAQARYGAHTPAGVIELVTRDIGAY